MRQPVSGIASGHWRAPLRSIATLFTLLVLSVGGVIAWRNYVLLRPMRDNAELGSPVLARVIEQLRYNRHALQETMQ